VQAAVYFFDSVSSLSAQRRNESPTLSKSMKFPLARKISGITRIFIKTIIYFFQDKKIIASRQKFIFIRTKINFHNYAILFP
jgi:hypothetical protein